MNALASIAAAVPFRPRDPQKYNPAIGLIGCGGITKHHLEAYRAAGYRVTALSDIDRAAAEKQRAAFYPEAKVFTDHRDLLRLEEIEVVDIATHPPVRPPLIEDALRAGKHVLSQKPFVLDLEVGRRLADLADAVDRRLAVNQNGRWAPHFSFMREAVAAGLIGQVSGVHLSVHWDHSWVRGTEFEKIHHLILYDYAIHWFDMVCCLLAPRRALRVYASTARTASQTISPPLLGQALIEFEDAQATLAFDAGSPVGSEDRSIVCGDAGMMSSVGPGNKVQRLTLATEQGSVEAKLTGSWFSDGFHGTMGELLRSIEEGREPTIGARANLDSLALCFAAIASSERHEAVVPGSVSRLPG